MKFSLALIALFCVSTINANPVEDAKYMPFAAILINRIQDQIDNFENSIPEWVSSDSLEENVLTILNKRLESGTLFGWSLNENIEENLVNAFEASIESLGIKSFDINNPFSENLYYFVGSFLNLIPSPSWLPKLEIQKQMVDNLIEAFKDTKVSGFDVNKSFKEDVVAWVVDSLADAQKGNQKASLEEIVVATVKNALAKVKLPGFSPYKTFSDNIAELIQNLIPY